METIISIIIPAYNVAGYIEKCLDSILAQSFRDFEVIIIDDGSTDNTPAICDEYAKKDERIRVIHKINEGVSIARNTGIDASIGKYILFFDGDDFVESETCYELLEAAKENDVDTVLYGYHTYADGAIKTTMKPIFNAGIYKEDEIKKDILKRFIGVSKDGVNNWLRHEENALYVENPALWRAMVSSDIIKENNLCFNSNLKVGEDTIFITEYLSHSKKCMVIDKCYYYLVIRDSSTIAVYEKDYVAKLTEKLKLVHERVKLTKRIKSKSGIDITDYWSGTVMMSVVELAFLFSKKQSDIGFKKRYGMFKSFTNDEEVIRIIKSFKLKKALNIMTIPLVFVKYRLNSLLFFATYILNKVGFKFQRN